MPNTFNVKLISIKYLCGHNPLIAKKKNRSPGRKKETFVGNGARMRVPKAVIKFLNILQLDGDRK